MEAKDMHSFLQLAAELVELIREDDELGGRLLGQKTVITANRFRVLLEKYGYVDEMS